MSKAKGAIQTIFDLFTASCWRAHAKKAMRLSHLIVCFFFDEALILEQWITVARWALKWQICFVEMEPTTGLTA
jgi:hypothetical protein